MAVKKVAPILAKNATNYYINRGRNAFITSEGSRIRVTNNEIKIIIEVIWSFENRAIFLKGTTEKSLVHYLELVYH